MSIIHEVLAYLPPPVAAQLRALKRRLTGVPPVGRFNFGDFRRLSPASRAFGYERGQPIDRYYIENFLAAYAADIAGRVLEIGDNEYTLRFGGARVTRSDILHVHAGNPKATIVGDLADAPHVPSESFDAIILTQTLLLVYDLRSAVATLHRVLKPGGVLLVTVPGVSWVPTRSEWGDTWYWAFSEPALRRLLSDAFGDDVQLTVAGNVLAAVAFLEGLSAQELERSELDHVDPDYPVTIAARAVKRGATA